MIQLSALYKWTHSQTERIEMSLSSWRQFPFFDCIPIRDPNYGQERDKTLYSDPTVTAIGSTDDYLVISNSKSVIKFIDRKFKLKYSFQAYDSSYTITKLFHIDTSASGAGILCSIAEIQGKPSVLKLWDMKRLFSMTNTIDYESEYLSQCTVSNGPNNHPLTCFSYTSDFKTLAFGYANGTVILVRGDFLHDRGSRQRVVFQSEDPVTSVHFKDDTLLFVTTTSKILTIRTSTRNTTEPEQILEGQNGADVNCTDIIANSSQQTKMLVVARKEGLQFYNSKGKAQNLLINISKSRLFVYNERYILFITSRSASLTGNGDTNMDSVETSVSTSGLLIIDVIGRFVAFNQVLTSTVVNIFEMWGSPYLYTMDGMLYKLHEKSLPQKLDILTKSELFPMAIQLATDFHLENLEVMKIEQQYADYLYKKQADYSGAINEYIKCIGLGRTSEVIRKYKENSMIPHLTKYLEALVAFGASTQDHVTLLLCSYCKLKQDKKIRNFVDSIEINEDHEVVVSENGASKDFDKEAVISLCRESGYCKIASFIARKFDLALLVVDIQINDLHKSKTALAYMRSLSVDDLLRVLLDKVRQLLDELPNETTQLLIDVFTGSYQPEVAYSDQLSTTSSLFEKSSSISRTESAASNSLNHPLLTSYKQFVAFMSGKGSSITEDASSVASSTVAAGLVAKDPTYLPPRPRIIFKCFVNHPQEFVIFLEACVESYNKFGGKESDKKDLLITLYEMYLSLARERSSKSSDVQHQKDVENWESKAAALLKVIRDENNWDLDDQTSLLLLSSVADFNEGETIVREAADESSEGFGLDIFRSAVMKEDYDRCYEIIKKYGRAETELYRLGLSVFTSGKDIYNKVGEKRIQKLIYKIADEKLMSPLEIIEQISLGGGKNFVKLGLVKQYLLDYIQKQKVEIQNNRKLIDSYRKDLKTVESGISGLLKKPQMINQTKCSACGQPLTFPLVHFKCSHSFHEHCLTSFAGSQANSTIAGDNGEDLLCPRCASQYEMIDILKKRREDVSQKNDLFSAALSGSTDRFKVMLGFIGRGALQPPKVVYTGEEMESGDSSGSKSDDEGQEHVQKSEE